MVALRWGGLAARALHLASPLQSHQSDASPYSGDSQLAAQALQGCLNVSGVIANTFQNAQRVSASARKTLSATGMPTSRYTLTFAQKRGFPQFINDYYDDEGWWALGLIRSWDVAHEQAYLDAADHIFQDMQNGTDATCGGGIWWNKDRNYKNAIANELYLSVAASLANRLPSKKQQYTQIAKDQWTWFKNSGMINSNNLINDGLTINADGTCVNNGMTTWSYNQGVVLGGLVELAKATGDSSYLGEATTIAKAAVAFLSDSNGIIHEANNCEPNCGGDGSQFKGIFVRNLHYLQQAAPQDAFRTAIQKNADSIWANDRNAQNQLGIAWTGPASAGGGPNASTHSSAMDVIVAALAVV
ncbi:glycoside hydrolase family 76 protein [Thermothielavioides terrestris NRRL 8126]|uniref:Glycoside hydrolase family 76 protein n=1 Tax=Thermothielavioides terrestris (strain ATCC 38088 / NRRL 8126) TaxID=578455 RepID=G2RDY3_THETT|nr:glycoside hydrolase family 76 protein [Thermothielavioides terrestris NRRL 8126]AEO70866.1 glycoside hydrolase family 76 protein [Thermothielavioides terrestris NRRL 8126]